MNYFSNNKHLEPLNSETQNQTNAQYMAVLREAIRQKQIYARQLQERISVILILLL
jgi:hypothetical protein